MTGVYRYIFEVHLARHLAVLIFCYSHRSALRLEVAARTDELLCNVTGKYQRSDEDTRVTGLRKCWPRGAGNLQADSLRGRLG